MASMFSVKKKLEHVDERSFDSLHRSARELFGFPRLFNEGILFSFSKSVQGVQVSNLFSLTTLSPSSYALWATYYKPEEPNSPIVKLTVDTDSSLSGVTLLSREDMAVKLVAKGSMIKGFLGYQGEVTKFFKNFSLGCKMLNVNPFARSGILAGNYLQSISPGLSLGCEVYYQFGPRGQYLIPVLGGRMQRDDWTACVSLSPRGSFEASLVKHISPKAGVATFIDVNLMQGSSSAGLCATYRFRDSTVYTQVNSNWVVAAVIEKELSPDSVRMTLSGMIDHPQGQSAFGLTFGVQL